MSDEEMNMFQIGFIAGIIIAIFCVCSSIANYGEVFQECDFTLDTSVSFQHDNIWYKATFSPDTAKTFLKIND